MIVGSVGSNHATNDAIAAVAKGLANNCELAELTLGCFNYAETDATDDVRGIGIGIAIKYNDSLIRLDLSIHKQKRRATRDWA